MTEQHTDQRPETTMASPHTGGAPADTAIPPTFSFELPLDARPEDVWAAISDGDQLARWFPMVARIKPGVGGSVFLSWGPQCEGEAPITIWEPGRRLGWREKHDDGAVMVTAVFEVIPERGGEACTIRVTQSGFGRGAKWADYYDSISSGWKFELRSLRHYLARHRGRPRASRWTLVPPPKPLPMGEVWARLSSPGGLCREGSIAGHTEGAPYALTGPDGRRYAGTVVRAVDGRMFAGTVRDMDDALFRIEIEPGAGHGTPCFWLSWWGGEQTTVDAIADAWSAHMRELLA